MRNAIGLTLALITVLPWIAWTAEGEATTLPALEVELKADAIEVRPRPREEVVRAIGLGQDPAHLEELIAILEQGDEQLRPIVIEALGRMGGVPARESLQSFLCDPRSTEVDRTFALRMLAEGALATEEVQATAEPAHPGTP